MLLILLAGGLPLTCGWTAAQDEAVEDFESIPPDRIVARNAAAGISTDQPGQGRAFLRLEVSAPRAYVRFPAKAGFHGHDRMSAAFRSPEAVEMRWLALDGAGRPVFQRRFRIEGGGEWVRLEEPLRAWRWGDQFVGDWDEVRELALRVESAAKTVDVDDVRLGGGPPGDGQLDWLTRTAFPDRPTRSVRSGNVFVATDAPDGFSDDDLRRLQDDMLRVRAFVRRVFGRAARPTDEAGPVSLLIFARGEDRNGFISRLGREWRAEIAQPGEQGYTVQDIATATYLKERGVRRPVYLHESAHAIVSRELHLMAGHGPHGPLQEGIANYLQLCAHPGSLDRGTYVRHFRVPIDPSGGGFFKPLEMLFDQRPVAARYAQLASLVAFLAENDRPLLGDLAAGLADGRPAAKILSDRETDWQKLQDAWLNWGRRRFAEESDPGVPLFDLPEEFR